MCLVHRGKPRFERDFDSHRRNDPRYGEIENTVRATLQQFHSTYFREDRVGTDLYFSFESERSILPQVARRIQAETFSIYRSRRRHHREFGSSLFQNGFQVVEHTEIRDRPNQRQEQATRTIVIHTRRKDLENRRQDSSDGSQ